MSGKMIEFKKSPKRIEFARWSAKWGQETGVSVCGIDDKRTDDDGTVWAVSILVSAVIGWETDQRTVLVYPGAVAEVCNYIPRGFRAGHTATFDKNGDLLIV